MTECFVSSKAWRGERIMAYIEKCGNDVANKDFGYIVKRYVNESITKKVMRKIYKLLKNS